MTKKNDDEKKTAQKRTEGVVFGGGISAASSPPFLLRLTSSVAAQLPLRGAAVFDDVGLFAVLEAVALQKVLAGHAASDLGDTVLAHLVSTGAEFLGS